ncbi:hypothetical protein ACX8XP_13040 [Calditrichota bacterium LG25]
MKYIRFANDLPNTVIGFTIAKFNGEKYRYFDWKNMVFIFEGDGNFAFGHVVTYKEEIANWVEGKTVLSGLKFKKIYGSYIHEMTHVLQSGCLGPSYALLYYLPPAPFAAYHYFFDRGPLTDYMTYHSLYNIFEYHAYINAANQSGYEQSMRIWLRIKWGY